jgi:hypothetical protein
MSPGGLVHIHGCLREMFLIAPTQGLQELLLERPL